MEKKTCQDNPEQEEQILFLLICHLSEPGRSSNVRTVEKHIPLLVGIAASEPAMMATTTTVGKLFVLIAENQVFLEATAEVTAAVAQVNPKKLLDLE